jgi:hypothetical protein
MGAHDLARQSPDMIATDRGMIDADRPDIA